MKPEPKKQSHNCSIAINIWEIAPSYCNSPTALNHRPMQNPLNLPALPKATQTALKDGLCGDASHGNSSKAWHSCAEKHSFEITRLGFRHPLEISENAEHNGAWRSPGGEND